MCQRFQYSRTVTDENGRLKFSLSLTPSISESPIVEPVPDQKNATVNEIKYDTRYDLKLTYRGTKLTATNNVITYKNVKYAVDSHEEAGTYNGLQRYNLSAHRFENYPAANS